MTGRLYRAELALLAGAVRVRWIMGALALMISASFLVAWNDARMAGFEARQVQAVERARWLGQDAKNPHSAAHFGQWVFKQASPLAILDPGIDPYVGRMVRVEPHRSNDAIFRSAQDRSSLARAGTGTVADILHLIVPLAAILLGFSAFAVDRERGTLRLALGNGASPARLVVARYAALMTLLAAAVALPCLALGAVAQGTLGAAEWQPLGRLVLWVGVEVGYVAVFLAIALFVSILAPTARGALAFSLLAWAMFCVAMPRLATAGVEAIAPTPSQQATLARIEAEIRRNNAGDIHWQREAALLARYGVSSPDDLPINMGGTLGHQREQHDNAVYDREMAGFNKDLLRQDRLAGWAGLASPMVAVQSVSQALAGTDYRRHLDFLANTERYRRLLVDTMNLDLAAHPAGPDGEYEADPSVWLRVPPYEYRPASIARSVRDAAVPLTILAGWMALALGLAATAARRMRP